jgi:hypothetical protein
MRVESHGGIILVGENEELRETPVPVPNPTWTDPGMNLGFFGERLVTNA